MEELQTLINGENKDVIIMGDMNINLINFTQHRKTNEFLENNFSLGYMPLITQPTRFYQSQEKKDSATLIDHIWVNKQDVNAKSGIMIADLADHFGIFSIVQMSTKHKTRPISESYRSYNQTNLNLMNNLLDNTDFSSVLDLHCPDKAYTKFNEIYSEAHDIAFPLKTRQTPKKYIKRSPWISAGLVQSAITKSKLLLNKRPLGLKAPLLSK